MKILAQSFSSILKMRNLKRTVDIILSSISLAQHDIIFHHWSSKPDLWALKQSVVFTQKEIDWLKQHNELKVVINSLNAPLHFMIHKTISWPFCRYT